MFFEYDTSGVCSKRIIMEIDGEVIQRVSFVGGCQGNTAGLAALVAGRKVSEVIDALKGIQCRNGTSCPDQLAKALQEHVCATCTRS